MSEKLKKLCEELGGTFDGEKCVIQGSGWTIEVWDAGDGKFEIIGKGGEEFLEEIAEKAKKYK